MSGIKTKKMSIAAILKRLFIFTEPVKKELAGAVAGGIVGGLAKIGIYIFSGTLIAIALGLGGERDSVIPTAMLILCVLLIPICYYYEMYKGHDVAYHLLAIMRTRMFKEIQRLSPAKLTGERTGDIISTLIADVDTLEIFFAHLVAPIFTAIVCGTFSFCFIWFYSPKLALIILPFYLYTAIVSPLLISKAGRSKGRVYRTKLGDLKAYILDSLRGLKEILIYRAGDRRLEEIDRKGHALNDLQISLNRQNTLLSTIPSFIIQLSRIITFAACEVSVLKGELDPINSVILMLMIPASFDALTQLDRSASGLVQTFGSAERVFAIIDESPQVEDNGKLELSGEIEEIVFDNISFKYPETEAEVLKNFSLSVKRGENIGLMGQSGCGKSTLMHLLLRFWDPEEGEIRINGRDIRKYTLESLRKSISMMQQDTFMFDDTIMNNIKTGNPEAGRDAVEAAAKRASIHDMIVSLPSGYETKVGELGGRLSGGERQRLGIARTLLKNSETLLLDEPTSSLDVLNEKGLLKTIDEEFDDKTVMMISHRPSTLGGCDRVVHFK